MLCNLCPRNCMHERDGQTICGVGTTPKLARAALHFGEEPCISGKRGSGTVFFSGCSLGCIYCQNRKISLDHYGKEVSISKLRDIYNSLIDSGAHNINLVTGSHFIPAIAKSLTPKLPVPVIFNCGGYERVETLKMLDGLIDIYLPDMKYYDKNVAFKYSNAYDYPDIASAAIAEMYRQTGDCIFNKEGVLLRGLIVRHLILPGQVQNSLEVIDWFKGFSKGKDILFSLMSQFTPTGGGNIYPELSRQITDYEFDAVKLWLFSSGIENGYIQDPESASTNYIPDFNLTGI